MGRREKAGLLVDLVAQLLELLFRKDILVVRGEKLVDPQEEGLFLDRKFIPGLDENSGDGEASFLAVDAFLVGFSIDSSRVMMKAEMSGVGASIGNQILQYFLLHFGPDGVGKQKNIMYLGLGVKESIAGPASNAAA